MNERNCWYGDNPSLREISHLRRHLDMTHKLSIGDKMSSYIGQKVYIACSPTYAKAIYFSIQVGKVEQPPLCGI